MNSTILSPNDPSAIILKQNICRPCSLNIIDCGINISSLGRTNYSVFAFCNPPRTLRWRLQTSRFIVRSVPAFLKILGLFVYSLSPGHEWPILRFVLHHAVDNVYQAAHYADQGLRFGFALADLSLIVGVKYWLVGSARFWNGHH